MMKSKSLSISEHEGAAKLILQQPYMRAVIPQEDGTFLAEIVEFPGCIASGETYQEAYKNLECVAESWIESVLANGKSVPAPMDGSDHSGKVVLRMPRSLHRKAVIAAQREGVSLNHLIVSCLAEGIGTRSQTNVATPPVVVNYIAPHYGSSAQTPQLRRFADAGS